MFFVDSHCHLNFPDYQSEQDKIIEQAENAGIGRFLTVGTKLEERPDLIALTRRNPHIFASIGIHPEYAAEQGGKTLSPQDICAAANDPKIVAIGEAGLDYHYGAKETHEAQKALFRIQLKAAKQSGLPIIIHSREAEDDTIALLQEEAGPGLRGVLHCFSSREKLAQAGLELGFYISASGIITFKSAEELRCIFKSIPMDRLLIETDAPFLAPVPFRGHRNEPAFMIKTAEVLAELKEVSLDQLRHQTTENFFTLFSKAA
ncbi:MAG: TatD family hydrolase [Alphaproteobacteria bacterium]|nr:TatD family hydrolase [Alphaproteobacteria bacterium]